MFTSLGTDNENEDSIYGGDSAAHRQRSTYPRNSQRETYRNELCYGSSRNAADWSFTLSIQAASSDGIDGYLPKDVSLEAHNGKEGVTSYSGNYSEEAFWLMPNFESKGNNRSGNSKGGSINRNRHGNDNGNRVNIKNTPIRSHKDTWQKRIPRS
jgi:hypothetical protein